LTLLLIVIDIVSVIQVMGPWLVTCHWLVLYCGL